MQNSGCSLSSWSWYDPLKFILTWRCQAAIASQTFKLSIQDYKRTDLHQHLPLDQWLRYSDWLWWFWLRRPQDCTLDNLNRFLICPQTLAKWKKVLLMAPIISYTECFFTSSLRSCLTQWWLTDAPMTSHACVHEQSLIHAQSYVAAHAQDGLDSRMPKYYIECIYTRGTNMVSPKKGSCVSSRQFRDRVENASSWMCLWISNVDLDFTFEFYFGSSTTSFIDSDINGVKLNEYQLESEILENHLGETEFLSGICHRDTVSVNASSNTILIRYRSWCHVRYDSSAPLCPPCVALKLPLRILSYHTIKLEASYSLCISISTRIKLLYRCVRFRDLRDHHLGLLKFT